jgi:hypothetical protein
VHNSARMNSRSLKTGARLGLMIVERNRQYSARLHNIGSGSPKEGTSARATTG